MYDVERGERYLEKSRNKGITFNKSKDTKSKSKSPSHRVYDVERAEKYLMSKKNKGVTFDKSKSKDPRPTNKTPPPGSYNTEGAYRYLRSD